VRVRKNPLVAILEIVTQRVLVRFSFEVPLDIESRIKLSGRIAVLPISLAYEMFKRIDLGVGYVLIGFKIIFGIELR
jgi:hypothetical protein